jgi:hypothetical protein
VLDLISLMAIAYWLADAVWLGGCRLNIHYASDWISLIGIEYWLADAIWSGG